MNTRTTFLPIAMAAAWCAANLSVFGNPIESSTDDNLVTSSEIRSVTPEATNTGQLPLTLSPLRQCDASKPVQSGKVIVVDVWASWCGNCYAAMEKFQSVAKANPQWKDKVEFIAATVDTSSTAAISAVQRQGWNSTRHCKADLAELNRLGIRRVPTLLIISPEGQIVKVTSPFSVNIENEISRLLS